MTRSFGQILKKDQVKLSAPCRLDAGGAAASQLSPGAHGSGCTTSARIAQTNPQGIIIEFTCSCGTKSYIQCDYASQL